MTIEISKKRILDFLKKLKTFKNDFRDVDLEYMTPSEAIIQYINYDEEDKLKLEIKSSKDKYNITVNKKIHQIYPWIAVQDHNGKVEQLEDKIKIISDTSWEVPMKNLMSAQKIGVAASCKNGETDVLLFEK